MLPLHWLNTLVWHEGTNLAPAARRFLLHSWSFGLRFPVIGIIGKPHHQGAAETMLALREFLQARGHQVLTEEVCGKALSLPARERVPILSLGTQCQLVIVVGGDGSMLHAARALSNFDIPVLGINRGHLGFLTDISPLDFREKVTEVLEGQYTIEKRFLLAARVLRHEDPVASSEALNDIVLYPGEISKMIEFEVYVNDQFVYSQRSDGLIVTTPTGSTAYALSAGGAIMHPSLNAVALVPMFPHTLTARPIVLDGDSKIEIVVAASNRTNPQLSCDGQVHIKVQPGDSIVISKKPETLWLVHPEGHDYYHVLRNKLNWGSKL